MKLFSTLFPTLALALGLASASTALAEEKAAPAAPLAEIIKNPQTAEELKANASAGYRDVKFDITPKNVNNVDWAERFPLQYGTWLKTKESEHIGDALAEDPRLVVLWSGYAFAKEYNHPRGHYYAITDVRNILRTGAPADETSGPQPAACWTCKGPDVARLIAEKGEDGYFNAKWAKWGNEIVNAIGCADCHDTSSKAFYEEGKPELRVARPHVLRALDKVDRNFARSDTTDKRVAVCANCHVEYYFANKTHVTFPWDKGLDADSIEKYYDTIQFTDWVHGLSKTPMLKAQHPDFEIWAQGMHGKNGVTCIDCHMAKTKSPEGKVFTDHQIANPFDNFENTCANCHDQSKEKLQGIVEKRKKDTADSLIRLEDQIVHAHFEAKAAWDAGATEEEMKPVQQDIRHAQWRWDYVAASHGVHAHSPEVGLHVLTTGLDKAADARRKLAVILTKHNVAQPVAIPDISTKEKAQLAIGLDMEKENGAKQKFIKEVLPQWDKQAAEKGLKVTDPAK